MCHYVDTSLDGILWKCDMGLALHIEENPQHDHMFVFFFFTFLITIFIFFNPLVPGGNKKVTHTYFV